jgi:hypothetical protein
MGVVTRAGLLNVRTALQRCENLRIVSLGAGTAMEALDTASLLVPSHESAVQRNLSCNASDSG